MSPFVTDICLSWIWWCAEAVSEGKARYWCCCGCSFSATAGEADRAQCQQHMTFGMGLGLLQVWWTGRVQDQCARSRPNNNPTTLASVVRHGSMHFADGPSQITSTGPSRAIIDSCLTSPSWSWAYFNREGSLSLVLFAEQRHCNKFCPNQRYLSLGPLSEYQFLSFLLCTYKKQHTIPSV